MTFRRFNKFVQLEASDKMLFLEVFAVLLFAKIAVLIFPFKTIAARLGELNGTARESFTSDEQVQVQNLKRAVFAISANVPWRSVCLDQALCASYILNRRKLPNTLFFGVRIDEKGKKLDAHAWVKCANKVFVGGQHSCRYTIVAFFSRQHVL